MTQADETREKFHISLQKEWVNLLSQVFSGSSIPDRCEWKSINDIIGVLNIIGKKNKNHLFFPTGGGDELTGATRAEHERGCIELNFDGAITIVKPRCLEFFKIDDSLICSYFRLILDEIAPSGCYDELSDKREELIDIDGVYDKRIYWDEGYYNDEPLPKQTRLITRAWGKCMLIFGKGSPYNTVSFGKFDAYFAEMTNMETDELNSFLVKLSSAVNERKNN